MKRIWISQAIATVMLLWALNPENPYGYYILLPWAAAPPSRISPFKHSPKRNRAGPWHCKKDRRDPQREISFHPNTEKGVIFAVRFPFRAEMAFQRS